MSTLRSDVEQGPVATADEGPSNADQLIRDAEQAAEAAGGPCVTCHNQDASRRSLYAICARAEREWNRVGRSHLGFTMRYIPFVTPLSSAKTVEAVEGEDVVVPVPVSLCDRCWRDINGGIMRQIPMALSQILLLTAIGLMVTWFVSTLRGGEFPFYYGFGCWLASLPFQATSEAVEAKWPERVKACLDQVPAYNALIDAYPHVEIVTREPTALVAE